MKKFFAFFAAALFVSNMFAADPTKAQIEALASDPTTNVVLVVNYPNLDCPSTNGVYAVGSYTEPAWNLEKTTNNKKFKELDQFPGWFMVEVPYADGLAFKPLVGANPLGDLMWSCQPSTPDKMTIVEKGPMTVAADGAESKMEYTAAGIVIVKINELKEGTNPCTAKWHNYTLNIYAPDCQWVEPTIAGEFNGWTDANVKMTMKYDAQKEVYYTFTAFQPEGANFKVKGGEGYGNPIMHNKDDVWEELWPGSTNAVWPVVAGQDTTIVWDWMDEDEWKWKTCEEPADSMEYTVTVLLPICEYAVPSISGSFEGTSPNNWTGTGIAMTPDAEVPGMYTVTVKALPTDMYKFADNVKGWANEVLGQPSGNYTFGHEQSISQDLSDETTYSWKACEPTGIINNKVKATAVKTIENGKFVIKMANKTFNAQGIQF